MDLAPKYLTYIKVPFIRQTTDTNACSQTCTFTFAFACPGLHTQTDTLSLEQKLGKVI